MFNTNINVRSAENDPDTLICEMLDKTYIVNKVKHPELFLAITIAVIEKQPERFIK